MSITHIEVHSDRPLTDTELQNIQNILQNSKCPNESLINSIDGYRSLSDGVITIGTGEGYTAHIEI